MERALISGEHKSKLVDLDKMEARKQRLIKRAQKIEASMRDCQMKQDQDQQSCRRKLEIAQSNMKNMEQKLASVSKQCPEYDKVFEEYLFAQETLDNERKMFEDLEFHHLEEEADWLASREELQREILDLSQRIESTKAQIEELNQQKIDTSQTSTSEFKTIEHDRMECLKELEKVRNEMKEIDSELHTFANQESEPEISSDSDSDKYKEQTEVTSKVLSVPLTSTPNLSCSLFESISGGIDDASSMSQSFNEKMFQEKSVLEGGIGKQFVIFSASSIIMLYLLTN